MTIGIVTPDNNLCKDNPLSLTYLSTILRQLSSVQPSFIIASMVRIIFILREYAFLETSSLRHVANQPYHEY